LIWDKLRACCNKLVCHHLLNHIITDMTNMHVYVCHFCNDVTPAELATFMSWTALASCTCFLYTSSIEQCVLLSPFCPQLWETFIHSRGNTSCFYAP
jgi:hypothetical protein